MIEEICAQHCVKAVCEAMGLSRSGHYARSARKTAPRSREDLTLGDRIESIYRESRCVYGYPRIRLALRAKGRFHGRRRIARLMRERSLKGRKRGRFKPWTTHSSRDCGYARNLMAERPAPSQR